MFPKLHFKFPPNLYTRFCDLILEQPSWFQNKMTTDSDSECSYVNNLAGFNVIRVIIKVIVIVINIIVIK